VNASFSASMGVVPSTPRRSSVANVRGCCDSLYPTYLSGLFAAYGAVFSPALSWIACSTFGRIISDLSIQFVVGICLEASSLCYLSFIFQSLIAAFCHPLKMGKLERTQSVGGTGSKGRKKKNWSEKNAARMDCSADVLSLENVLIRCANTINNRPSHGLWIYHATLDAEHAAELERRLRWRA
jgi:hypothetical protein